MENLWLHRFSVVVAVCTFLLVIAGGLVTSNDAALAIPDWPLAYGKLVPPLEGGIRFEFAHRVLAATVLVLTFALAVWTRRALAWLAFAAVVAQALLGAVAVKLVDPKALAIAHACLAQICFGLVMLMTCQRVIEPRPKGAVLAAAIALFIQTILGAAVRHNAMSAVPHIIGAGVVTLIVMWAGIKIFVQRARAATLLLTLTFSQIFLGMGSYFGRILNAEAPQPQPMMIWFTVAHVAVGSLAFGTAVAIA